MNLKFLRASFRWGIKIVKIYVTVLRKEFFYHESSRVGAPANFESNFFHAQTEKFSKIFLKLSRTTKRILTEPMVCKLFGGVWRCEKEFFGFTEIYFLLEKNIFYFKQCFFTKIFIANLIFSSRRLSKVM